MHRGRITPPKRTHAMSDMAMLFDVAFGRYGKTKAIARGVGCSPRQARRMIDRKTIPAALREAVLRLAHKQLDAQLAKIEAARDVVRQIEVEEAQEARDCIALAGGPILALGNSKNERPEVPAVAFPENGEGR